LIQKIRILQFQIFLREIFTGKFKKVGMTVQELGEVEEFLLTSADRKSWKELQFS